MGAYSPLLSTANVSEAAIEQYHGEDGFADVFNQEPDMSLLRYTHAVYALNKITMENSGKREMSSPQLRILTIITRLLIKVRSV